MLVSPGYGLAVGITNYGKGKVLFVNVPLGYFAGKTDGMRVPSNKFNYV